jgi:hypothetical protein
MHRHGSFTAVIVYALNVVLNLCGRNTLVAARAAGTVAFASENLVLGAMG